MGLFNNLVPWFDQHNARKGLVSEAGQNDPLNPAEPLKPSRAPNQDLTTCPEPDPRFWGPEAVAPPSFAPVLGLARA